MRRLGISTKIKITKDGNGLVQSITTAESAGLFVIQLIFQMRCAQYWPDEGEETYGSVSVTLKEAESFADFDIRTFTIMVVSVLTG